MSYTKKQANNTTTTTEPPLQNLWCRDAYCQYIIKNKNFNPFRTARGSNVRMCNYSSETCRGAHSPENIKPYPHIASFNRLNKEKYFWVGLYNNLVKTLQEDEKKLLALEHKKEIANITNLNFVELIQLWRKLACYYRKIFKECRNAGDCEMHTSGYTKSIDVPCFNLDPKVEDTAWAFERLTKFCDIFKTFENSLASGELVKVWDLCLGTGINCKEGVHYTDEMICVNDFLTGTCSCLSKDEMEEKKCKNEEQERELLQEKIELSKELAELIKTKKNKKRQNEITSKISTINVTINKIVTEYNDITNRLIHYTENGMIPFNQQLSLYLREEEEKKLLIKEPEKAGWDHVENTEPTVKAVKVSKLGSKKK